MMRKSWNDWPIAPGRAYRLSSMIDKWADRGQRGLSDVVGGLGQQGIHLDLDDLAFIAQMYQSYTHEPSVPPWIITFVTRLLDSRHTMAMLNPFGGNGLTGAILGRNLAPARVDVLCRQASDCVVPEYLRVQKVRYLYGDLAYHARDLVVPYDAVASFPPMGLRKERATITAPDGTSVELYDDPSLLELAQLPPVLSPQGMVVWLVPPRFVWESGQDSVRRKLPLLGLHISAMFHIPRGSFEYMGIAAELVVLERHQSHQAFVGEIPKDTEAQDGIIRRFFQRERGASPSEGRLVNLEEYRGLEWLASQEALDRYARTPGLRTVKFSEAVTSVDEATTLRAKELASDVSSALVFLPRSAMTPALAGQTALRDTKRSGYLQLSVDSEVLLPEYLAAFLNSREGYVFRRSLLSGVTVPHINKTALQGSVLYLPGLATQQDLAKALSRIASLRADLNELESRLMSDPNDSPAIVRRLDAYGPSEGFGYWLETLPFPLAAILREYVVASSDREKYELLLKFFEVFAEFLATVLLSAWRSVPQLWQSVRDKLGSDLRTNHLSVSRSTFGLWNSVYSLLAHEVRGKLNGQTADREFCLRTFHIDEPAILQAVCAKEIVGVLQTASGWRNTWAAHAGAVNRQEAASLRRLAEERLLTLRNSLGTVFDDYQLVLPGESTVMHGGTYKYQAKRVMGSNALLENIELHLSDPAESDSLYCYQLGQPSALRLIGLLELREAPQSACFFFNRVQQNRGLRFVTYQVASESERFEAIDQDEILDIIRELDASGS